MFFIPQASVSGDEELVDLNTATIEELARVSGIGEEQAAAIVEGRPYDSVKDLLKISGIDSNLLNILLDMLVTLPTTEIDSEKKSRGMDKEAEKRSEKRLKEAEKRKEKQEKKAEQRRKKREKEAEKRKKKKAKEAKKREGKRNYDSSPEITPPDSSPEEKQPEKGPEWV